MHLPIAPYLEQAAAWPASGRHVLACFDDSSIVVYQAFRPTIRDFAVANGYLGGPFSLSRMSWIKPNFLWMMYRSGWATKPDQECVLAIRLRRSFFDQILGEAVHSMSVPGVYGDDAAWQRAVKTSDVRLQWDPDHAPGGAPQERRAIQLGLRGEALRRYAREALLEVTDMTAFVAEQRARVGRSPAQPLMTPAERVYPAPSPEIAARLGLS